MIKIEENQLTAVFIGHNKCYGLDDSILRETIINAINAGVDIIKSLKETVI